MRWTRGCQRGAAAMGRDIDVARKYKGWLQQAGCKSSFDSNQNLHRKKDRYFFGPIN